MRSVGKSAALLAEAAAEGLDIETRQLDVCDPDSIADALVDAADIDVLVNNAGFEVQGAIEMIDDELMHRQLDTKVLGPLRVIRSVMPAWRERGHGVIVNVSSVVGRATSPFGGAKTSMSFEDFEQAMRSTINWYDWTARRARPATVCRSSRARASLLVVA